MLGHKRKNQLLANANLGITGAFEPIYHTITWKPEEKVDYTRAQKLCEVLKNAINQTYPDFECQSVELLQVSFT
jgi:hypothetical protein